MSAFDDWLKRRWQDDGQPVNLHIIDEAFKAGRAYQREVDARIADYNSEGIDQDGYHIYVIEIEKAIMEQKIDD